MSHAASTLQSDTPSQESHSAFKTRQEQHRSTDAPTSPYAPRREARGMPPSTLPTIRRFFHLLIRVKLLVQIHGPYTTYDGTIVFSRAPLARDNATAISTKAFAKSFAAAQDCTGSAQIPGPAEDDLAIFEELWNTTATVFEDILDSSTLDHEIFGWAIIGLCAGYIPHKKWNEDSQFLSHKTRLKDALESLPSIERKLQSSLILGAGRVANLAKVNREVHICANLLLQQFRREDWVRIRWFHAIAVAEKCLGHLGFVAEDFDSEEVMAGFGSE